MRLRDRLLENALVYRAWQAPFARQKLAPLVRRGYIEGAKRVLDVGCGPGTNAQQFAHADYLGVDVNPAYVATASRRHGRRFVVADVTSSDFGETEKFDLILVNSLLHHLDAPSVQRLLDRLGALLSPDGHVHILELVLPPERNSVPALLAKADRGRFARSIFEWSSLIEQSLAIDEVEPDSFGRAVITQWDMVYCGAHQDLVAELP